MKRFLLALLLYSFVFCTHGIKIAEFEDLYDLKYFFIDGNDLFAVDGESIKHFSIKDMELKRIIGKKGEGPGEFKMAPMFQLFPDQIFVSDHGKILYFKRNGELIREKKISTDITIEKVRNNYLSTRDDFNMEKGVAISTFTILDQNLIELKKLYSVSREFKISTGGNKKREMKLFSKVKRSFTDGEFIFVMDTNRGFYFEILDYKGELLATVNRKFDPVKISSKYKKDFLAELRELKSWSRWGSRYDHVFPEYFPAFSHITGDGRSVYVYSQVDDTKKAKLTIFDYQGKFRKVVSIPRGDRSTVNNNRFYFMKENEDDEVWELHVINL